MQDEPAPRSLLKSWPLHCPVTKGGKGDMYRPYSFKGGWGFWPSRWNLHTPCVEEYNFCLPMNDIHLFLFLPVLNLLQASVFFPAPELIVQIPR